MINIGYDLSLFQVEELEIMCQKPGYFPNIAENMRKHFHCVIVSNNFEEATNYFINENIFVFNCGSYHNHLITYAKKLIPDESIAHGISYETFKIFHNKADRFINDKGFPISPDLSSFVNFVEIFLKQVKTSLKYYEEILAKIQFTLEKIQKHSEFSDSQVVQLDQMKENSKSSVLEHQNMTIKLQATKKELAEVEGFIDQDMSEYGEEQAAMLRLNMAIVEERTCQWSLFQRGLRDFDDAVLDENNVMEFNNIVESHNNCKDFIQKYQDVTMIDDLENFSVKLRYFFSGILQEYDLKQISLLGENEQLQHLKDKAMSELGVTFSGAGSGGGNNPIFLTLFKIHNRVITMAKSMKNILVKESKLQTLQKKCNTIEERLKEHRQNRRKLQARFGYIFCYTNSRGFEG